MLTLAQIQRVETHISYSMQVVVNQKDLEETRERLLLGVRSLLYCGLIYNADLKLFELYIDMWYDRVEYAFKEQEEKEDNEN